MVDEIRAKFNNEDAELEGDAEMHEVEDDNDPDIVEDQQGVGAQMTDMTQVLANISDLKAYMIQTFNIMIKKSVLWMCMAC